MMRRCTIVCKSFKPTGNILRAKKQIRGPAANSVVMHDKKGKQ